MAIRSVYGGYEATEGTACAPGALGVNYNFLRVVKFGPTKPSKLDVPKETTNSTITTQHPRPGPRHFAFTAQTRAYFDGSQFWFGMSLGAPSSALHGVETTVYDNTFKAGGTAPLSATLKWKQTGSKGTIWWQAVGCKVKQTKLMYVSGVGLVFEHQGLGRYPTSIAAPTVPQDTTANYNQPMSMDQQSLTLNAVAWTKPKKFDVTTDNGMTPDWAINNTRDIDRLKLGDTTTKADVQAFFDAYAGSLAEAHDSASSLLSAVILNVQDAASNIGTVPSHPTFACNLPKPYVDDTSDDDTPTDPEEKSSLIIGYDSSSASDANYVFTSLLTSAYFVGH